MRILIFLIALWLAGPLRAEPISEADMKANYAYNFAVFTDWPESTRIGFTICTFGDDRVAQAMKRFDGRVVERRRVIAARLSVAAGAGNCDVLFVGEREVANLPRLLAELRDEPVLTVTDAPGSVPACFQLALEGQRLVFDVNLDVCRRVNLMPQSKLLRLARQVRRGG